MYLIVYIYNNNNNNSDDGDDNDEENKKIRQGLITIPYLKRKSLSYYSSNCLFTFL